MKRLVLRLLFLASPPLPGLSSRLRAMRRMTLSLALGFSALLLAGPANAQPQLDLVWSGTTGAGVTGSDSIEAVPGDRLTVDIVVIIDIYGFTGASFDLVGSNGLTADANSLVPSSGGPPECPQPPHLAPGTCFSATLKSFSPSLPGVVDSGSSTTGYDVVGLTPEFLPGMMTIGRGIFTVGHGSSSATVSTFFSGPNGVIDGLFNFSVPPVSTAYVTVILPECEDGADNDADGFVDLQDPGCADGSDPSETHLRPGDYVLANFDSGSTTVFDPTTTRLSSLSSVGGLSSPWDVEVDIDGSVLVTSSGSASVDEVDPETGGATTISTGVNLSMPTGLALSSAGDVFVADATTDQIVVIDRMTGVQTLVSNDPALVGTDDLVLDPADDSLLVSDFFADLHRLSDPLGTPSLSSFSASVTQPRQMVLDGTGDVIVADQGLGAPLRFDPVLDTISPMISTTPFTSVQGAGAEPSGHFLFSDYVTGEIWRVSEANDSATILNVGREETGLSHLSVVPTPAMLTLALSDAIAVDGGTPGVADVGDTLEFTAVVTNVGPGPADLLSLESGLDPNLTLVASSLSTSQGTIVEGSLASDPRLEVDLGSLAPAASATVTWEVDVSDPAPGRSVTANAWVRREKVILVESDDPTTGPVGDANVVKVGAVDIVIQAFQKLSDTRGEFSGPGNPGSVLADSDFLAIAEPVGDRDGDGVEDVALSTWSSTATTNLYLTLLHPDGHVKQRTAVDQPPLVFPNDSYGRCAAFLGDLDGPGPADFALAVAAAFDNGSGTDRGAVHILFLQNDGTLVSSTRIADGGAGGLPNGTLDDSDYFGACVESLGDLDGPGGTPAAIAVGASADDAGGSNAGAVYVLFLNTDGTVSGSPVHITEGLGGFDGLIKEPGYSGNDSFGTSVEWLGDLDGDGNPEVAVGEERDDAAGLDAGALWILSLGSNGLALSGAVKHDGTNPALAAFSFAGNRLGSNRLGRVSDLDGDGLPELLVRSNTDMALLFLASDKSIAKVEPWSDALAHVPGLPGAVHWAAQEIGDLDGDGRPEIAMGPGDELDDDGGVDRGAVYILYPDAIPVPEPGFLLGLWSGLLFLATVGRRRRRP